MVNLYGRYSIHTGGKKEENSKERNSRKHCWFEKAKETSNVILSRRKERTRWFEYSVWWGQQTTYLVLILRNEGGAEVPRAKDFLRNPLVAMSSTVTKY